MDFPELIKENSSIAPELEWLMNRPKNILREYVEILHEVYQRTIAEKYERDF